MTLHNCADLGGCKAEVVGAFLFLGYLVDAFNEHIFLESVCVCVWPIHVHLFTFSGHSHLAYSPAALKAPLAAISLSLIDGVVDTFHRRENNSRAVECCHKF